MVGTKICGRDEVGDQCGYGLAVVGKSGLVCAGGLVCVAFGSVVLRLPQLEIQVLPRVFHFQIKHKVNVSIGCKYDGE